MNILENKSDLDIKSTRITIKSVVENGYQFNIPIYQRLYVWGETQIRTLLGDLYLAMTENKRHYYLGGIILTSNKNKYDLIDGQQRFTTLWLLSKVLKNSLTPFITIIENKEAVARISFSVREFANNYFNKNSESTFTEKEKAELNPIVEGLQTIENFIKDEVNTDEIPKFADFIYNNVLVIATQMPPETDENKVFEAMNNRGEQLEQHQILKSNFLKIIKDQKLMYQYGILWDSCSIMDNYLEANIKLVTNLTWDNLKKTRVENDASSGLKSRDEILKVLNNNFDNKKSTLLKIIDKDLSNYDKEIIEKKNSSNQNKAGGDKVRSILSFPMLLLHVLRIYQFRFCKDISPEDSAEVKGKNLLEIFDAHSSYFKLQKDVTNFIDLLWDIREKFDKNVIKWVQEDDVEMDEVQLIKKLYQSDNSLRRQSPHSNEGFALLQSMLYHSQQIITHYWLTPFLNKMLDVNNEQKLHQYLEALDNAMFCVPKKDLRKQSYNMMLLSDTCLNGDIDYVRDVLNEALGTLYPSYWFYKTEYLLWKNRYEFYDAVKWQDFKITAKNSVEHISPQNPSSEDHNLVFDKMDDEQERRIKKDDFGNLVLLSPGMNSEYSNKPYNVKMTEFHNKRRMDSLKSDLIFIEDHWNWERCKSHKETIIKLFVEHLNL